MKSTLHLLAPTGGRQAGALNCRAFRAVLLILPWITTAPAQNSRWFSPEVGIEPGRGSVPLVEPTPGLSTNWNLGSIQSAGFGGSALAKASAQDQPPSSSPAPDATPRTDVKLDAGWIWERGVGEGFRSSTASIGMSAGVLGGMDIFGGMEHHDLALVSLNYGHMLTHTWGDAHWYRGNLELRFELFTGAQFHPETQWLVGLTPHLRYNFATGTRWIPFFSRRRPARRPQCALADDRPPSPRRHKAH